MATGEGMANAIMHGGRVRTVTVSVVDDIGIVAEVHDDGQAAAFGPPPKAPPADREGGRGLLLAYSIVRSGSAMTTGRGGTVLMLEMDYRH